MIKSSLLSYLPGAVVVLGGLLFALGAASYPLGTLLRPGPGFFPMVIGVALALMGLGVLAETRRSRAAAGAADEPFAWRAVLFTVASVLVFAFSVERIGYVPAALLLIAIAGLAERRSDWPALLLVALFMAVFGTLVFIWGLGLPLKAVGAS
ncbi:tripartite tricarboxylate transporter TctB family protein [Pseudodonghicola flavimaris]|uniref:Tripartite tricarboxylate transporter TctB family protein n=1 Tax=Pseudodonghicola flavimaris TaxID=3050036 RepID=A0ABT7F2L2_9RHOB|nr:tripartite tricarboxylate transporter TctB family protein [Pseudodonghicola flavimaris]MDK3018842.1 tripartite tricarboxylate transporter TctB family protein [Pseudodonghicola flavimaris]